MAREVAIAEESEDGGRDEVEERHASIFEDPKKIHGYQRLWELKDLKEMENWSDAKNARHWQWSRVYGRIVRKWLRCTTFNSSQVQHRAQGFRQMQAP
jgi:hypothetical protein